LLGCIRGLMISRGSLMKRPSPRVSALFDATYRTKLSFS
jgi:hypothetical protein